MIKEILPIKIWHAPVNNFEAVQEEISRAVETANWDYYQESSWGRTQKYWRENPFTHDAVSEFNMVNLQEEIWKASTQLYPDYQFSEHSRPMSVLTKYDVGDYSHIHAHSPAYFSGAYYYKVDNQTNNFFFHANGERKNMEAKEGDLLIFPGWIEHGVTTVSEGSRIILSFNLML